LPSESHNGKGAQTVRIKVNLSAAVAWLYRIETSHVILKKYTRAWRETPKEKN